MFHSFFKMIKTLSPMNISKVSLNLYKCKHCNCMQQICTSSLVDSSRIVENQQTVEHKIFCCIVVELHPNNLSSFKVNFLDCILIFFLLLFLFFLKSVTFFSEWIIMLQFVFHFWPFLTIFGHYFHLGTTLGRLPIETGESAHSLLLLVLLFTLTGLEPPEFVRARLCCK